MGGVFFFTSFYLQNVRGYTPLAAGLLTVPFAAWRAAMSPRSARMVQRYGAKAVGATGMFVMAAAIAGYATLGTHLPIWLLGVLFGIQGAVIGVSMPAATAAVMDVLPRERACACLALTNTARQVAVALSVAILGSILAEFYRSCSAPRWPACWPRPGARRPPRSPPPRRSRSSSVRPGGHCSGRRMTRSCTRCASPR